MVITEIAKYSTLAVNGWYVGYKQLRDYCNAAQRYDFLLVATTLLLFSDVVALLLPLFHSLNQISPRCHHLMSMVQLSGASIYDVALASTTLATEPLALAASLNQRLIATISNSPLIGARRCQLSSHLGVRRSFHAPHCLREAFHPSLDWSSFHCVYSTISLLQSTDFKRCCACFEKRHKFRSNYGDGWKEPLRFGGLIPRADPWCLACLFAFLVPVHYFISCSGSGLSCFIFLFFFWFKTCVVEWLICL